MGGDPARGTPKSYLHPPHLQNFSSLSCDYFAVNQSRLLVCDLGNPMKAGASVSLGPSHAKLSWGKGRRAAVGVWQTPGLTACLSIFPVPQLWGGLRFTVPHLRDTKKTIQFDFQILR